MLNVLPLKLPQKSYHLEIFYFNPKVFLPLLYQHLKNTDSRNTLHKPTMTVQ